MSITPKDAGELRRFRKEALKDFMAQERTGIASYKDHLAKWSELADQLVAAALAIARNETGCNSPFSVLALGKLGGKELNYSSDIDVIFICDDQIGEATQLAQKLVRILSEATEDGFVYRVDTNLRPRGKDGPLVNQIDTLVNYYEYHALDWERQALLRARPCAGDLSLGQDLIERTMPCIYPRSTDLAFLKKIKSTKIALERTAFSEGWRNFKLGPGGIREAEFFVQALQMIHGGKERSLRVTNTFDAISRLAVSGHLSTKKATELTEAYTLLRRIENVVQGRHDRQTYVLPESPAERLEVATILGFHSAEELTARLDDVRTIVQRNFTELFEGSLERSEISESFAANLETCTDREQKIDSLAWFKNSTVKRLKQLDLDNKLDIKEAGERLSYLAEIIIGEALNIARSVLEETYGVARTAEGLKSEISIVGMGRLASFEMDFASDLDLLFVYTSDGETDGRKKITAAEYFTKMATSVISTLTIPTRYGRAFAIDTDLRPSGHQGVLVSSFEAFERYHKREAAFWERQALLRARPVAGSAQLGKRLKSLISELVFERPLPHNALTEIAKLRERAILENNANDKVLDIKSGLGFIADIESYVQYLQLLHGGTHNELRSARTFDVINEAKKLGIISDEDHKLIEDSLNRFRQVLSRLRIFAQTSTSLYKADSELAQNTARSLGLSSEELWIELSKRSALIRQRAFLSSPAPLCT